MQDCEQEVVDFLHSYGILETCKIYSSKRHWFRMYHYIQLSGDDVKLKYLYTKVCGAFEGDHELQVVTLEFFKRYVLEKVSKQRNN